jgi:hypothetical protein
MNLIKRITLVACVLVIGIGAASAGINSKEVGALLIYPEYWADDPNEPGSQFKPPAQFDVDTYITVTNDKSSPVNAHIEVIDGKKCDDCNFDLPLTGFQTKRLWFDRRDIGGGTWATVILDASPHSSDPDPNVPEILHACPGQHGFIVVSLEAPGVEPRTTLGENMLHGDEVVVNVTIGGAVQVGAIAVQGVGPNNGDRHFKFDNMEYAAFPSIVTGNFWAPNDYVDPRLILFNVNFETGMKPETWCSINYVNAEEDRASDDYHFDCWAEKRLVDIAPGFHENILGTANGFLWAQCSAGTHGAMMTFISSGAPNYPYGSGVYKDTLFQSVTTDATAELWLTPDITGTP